MTSNIFYGTGLTSTNNITKKKLLTVYADSQIDTLVKAEILIPLGLPEIVYCDECWNTHDVILKEGNVYGYFCPTGMVGFIKVDKDLDTIYKVDLLNTLHSISKLCDQGVDIDSGFKGYQPVGKLKLDNQEVELIFIEDSRIIKEVRSSSMPIFLTTDIVNEHGFPTLLVGGILSIDGRLGLDKDSIKEVKDIYFKGSYFNPSNGDLYYDGRKIVSLALNSHEYYFIKRLYGSLDSIVDYDTLARYISEHSASTNNENEPKFCQKLKSSIKSKSIDKKLLDTLISPATTIGEGYRLLKSVV